MTTISFELLDYEGKMVEHGSMPWYYAQPRIIKWQDSTYVLLSDVVSPGPDILHRYVLINPNSIYQPESLDVPDV